MTLDSLVKEEIERHRQYISQNSNLYIDMLTTLYGED
jgi:hypothetical protein